MTCADFHDRLSAYMDGELSRWRRWKVEVHLRRCQECSRFLWELEEVDQSLRAARDAAPAPDYITPAVMRRLPAMPPVARPRGGLFPALAGVAAVAVQIFALYGAYWWGFVRGRQAEPLSGRAAGMTAPTGPGAGLLPPPLEGNAPLGASMNGPANAPAFDPGFLARPVPYAPPAPTGMPEVERAVQGPAGKRARPTFPAPRAQKPALGTAGSR